MAFPTKCHFVIPLFILLGVCLFAGFPSGRLPDSGDQFPENATSSHATSYDTAGALMESLLNLLYAVSPLIRLLITGKMPEHWNILHFIVEAFILAIFLYQIFLKLLKWCGCQFEGLDRELTICKWLSRVCKCAKWAVPGSQTVFDSNTGWMNQKPNKNNTEVPSDRRSQYVCLLLFFNYLSFSFLGTLYGEWWIMLSLSIKNNSWFEFSHQNKCLCVHSLSPSLTVSQFGETSSGCFPGFCPFSWFMVSLSDNNWTALGAHSCAITLYNY